MYHSSSYHCCWKSHRGFCLLVVVWSVLFLLAKGQQQQQDNDNLPNYDSNVQLSHDVADAFVEVLTDANSPINEACTTTATGSAIPPQKGRIQKWIRSLFLSSSRPQSTSSTACHHSSTRTTQSIPAATDDSSGKDPPETTKKGNNRKNRIPSLTKRSFKAFESFRLYKNKEGVNKSRGGGGERLTTRRVVSGSFQVLSSSAGLVADSIKVTGDTAAGILGSSVRIMGTTVKFMGTSGLTIANKLQPLQEEAEEEKQVDDDDNGTTAKTCSSKDESNWTSQQQEQTNEQEQPPFKPLHKKQKQKQKQKNMYQQLRIIKRSKQAAANSFRVVGKIMDWTGESVLIAGAVAESLASSTTNVAEETIRIVENFAGTISLAMMKPRNNKNQDDSTAAAAESSSSSSSTMPPFFTFGRYSQLQNSSTTEATIERGLLLNQIRNRFYNNPSLEDAIMIMELLMADAIQFGNDISAEVQGIPSMANELAAALLFCHFLAILLLYQPNNNKPAKGSDQEEEEGDVDVDDDNDSGLLDTNGENKRKMKIICQKKKGWKSRLLEGEPDDSESSKNDDGAGVTIFCASSLQDGIRYCVRMPWRLFCWSLRSILRFVLSRRMVLLIFYLLIYVYLCRLSQQRVGAVQRRAEAVGYRNGIASITETSAPTETLLWLNHAVDKLWRVKQSQPQHHYYPPFVSRAFRQDSRESYGGLEPYISSAIGTGLVRSLEMAKAIRPTDVAYVSLFCLSLGRRPPMIRTIKLGDEIVKDDSTQIELDLEVDAFLEDLSMIFEVKLSSLSYALLPSTKIKIFNLVFRAPLKLILVFGSQFPFVSEVQLSFSKQPHCDFRAAPMSAGNESLSEVEMGLIPFLTTLLNDWIQEAIRSSLSSFVSPGYFAIDFSELLHSGRQDQPSIAPNLRRLRRQTQQPISSPRTSMPSGIAITSVADHLESRHSSMEAVGSNVKHSARRSQKKKPLLRPVTELSRLALDRHSLREDNLVKPVTELSRLGVERWLDSAVMAKRRKDIEEQNDQTTDNHTAKTDIKAVENS